MTGPEPATLPPPEIAPIEACASVWAQEYQPFQRLLPQLLPSYRGQYVAVQGGQVIARGSDKMEVALTAFRQVGNVAIHVGLVAEGPEPVVRSGRRSTPLPT